VRETALTIVAAAGFSVASAVSTPSVNQWVSDTVIVAGLAVLGRVSVAWIQSRRSTRKWKPLPSARERNFR
jgi:hypothetical protein